MKKIGEAGSTIVISTSDRRGPPGTPADEGKIIEEVKKDLTPILVEEVDKRVKQIPTIAGKPGKDGNPGKKGPKGDKGEKGDPGQDSDPEVVAEKVKAKLDPILHERITKEFGKLPAGGGAGFHPGDLPGFKESSPSTVFGVNSSRVLGFHSLTSSDVGLGNVDNTSDLNKPISTATQAALDLKADAVEGELNGFVDRTDATLSWDAGTRTLTITGSYDIYANGTKYSKTGDTIQIPDTEGTHFIYYDNTGTLVSSTTFTIDIITTYCFVASLYWDATNGEAVPVVLNEQHGVEMAGETHSYLHRTRGTVFESGLSITANASGNGSADSHCQFTAAAGVIDDEDITHTVLARSSLTDTIPVLYKSGATPVWRMVDDRSFPVLNTLGGNVEYNQFTGGSWQLTAAGSAQYVLTHIYATPGTTPSTGSLFAIAGENVYATLSAAREGAAAEALAIEGSGLPILEFVLVATFIVQTNAGYTNTPKARFVQTESGGDYIDWRVSAPVAGNSISATSWGTITGTISDQTDLQSELDAKLATSEIGSTVQPYDVDTLKADTPDVLTAGFAATPYNAGTKSSGTFTPDEANGNLQYAVNGGAHTLAPPTNNCSLVIQYTNNASAGAITTSGFTKVTGDTITTTDGDDFFFYVIKLNGFSHLNVVAMQ